MIVSVFVSRLKEGHTFKEFVEEWEADEGFGVPTRVFNGPSLDDPRMVVSIGFDAVTPDEVRDWLAAGSDAERARHARIDNVVESTQVRAMFEVRTEHDFSGSPNQIPLGTGASLLGSACLPLSVQAPQVSVAHPAPNSARWLPGHDTSTLEDHRAAGRSTSALPGP